MEQLDNSELNESLELIESLKKEMSRKIIGQEYLIERLLITLICREHILIEGVPGLAKTLAVTTLAKSINAKFNRIQFTPDLLPADLLGTLIYHPGKAEFQKKEGPVFTNILLADEVNRSPAKVQSALLESMQERQVTIGDESYKLPEPFMVLATQNPVEQEGTYPLPEAQMDRFMLKIKLDYPKRNEELDIIRRESVQGRSPDIKAVINPDQISELRNMVDNIYIDSKVEEYIVDIVRATRNPEECGREDLKEYIVYGASPRAAIYLASASRALALINGSSYVTPSHVKSILPDILRHRIVVSYEAEADNVTSEDIVKNIVESIKVP